MQKVSHNKSVCNLLEGCNTTLEEIQYHIVNNTKFTNLHIIKYVGKDITGHHIVKCLCNCGRIIETRYDSIKSGKTKSCGKCNLLDGCNTIEEEIQYNIDNKTKFTYITIIEYVGKDTKGNHIVKYKCDCGRIFETRYGHIKNGKTKSCGKCNILDGCNTVEEEIQYHIDNKTKFTNINIIEYVRKIRQNKKRIVYIVKCKCVCGRIFETTYSSIKSGHTKSCGNCNLIEGCNTVEEEIQYHINNNTKFTNINIIEYVRKIRQNKHIDYIVKCKCDCGRIFETRYGHIKSGNTKSCGKCNILDGCNTTEEEIQYHIDNKTKFTYITIIEYVGKDTYSNNIVKCKCDCGRIFETLYSSIKNGHTKSCGCSLSSSSFAEKELGRYLHSIIKETRYIETEEKQLRLYYNGSKNYFSYDIVVPYNNKNYIVEYNGRPWHPESPNQLDKNGNPWKKPHSDESAEYWYYYDQKKKQLAIDNGYEYIVVWDDEPREVVLKRIFETIGYSESNKQRSLTIDDFF